MEERLDEDWAAGLLRARVDSLRRVTRLDLEDAVPKGDNYASVLLRARAHLELEDGSASAVSFIVKQNPEGDTVGQLFSDALQPFKLEIKMYSEVLPVLEKLLQETEEEAKMWPTCWDFTPYSRIVLEDLTVCEYRTSDRMEAFSVDEAAFVLRALGRFHAASKVALAEGDLDGSQFDQYAITRNLKSLDEFYGGMIALLSEAVRSSWGPEWTNLADKLADVSRTFSSRLRRLREEDPEDLLVLNHGDFWPMNVMLRYDTNGQPLSIRMIDFQISHYASLCWDLTMFLFTSASPALRLAHYPRLLAAYHAGLAAALERLRTRLPCPAPADLAAEMDRLLFLGFFHVVGDLPYILAPKDNVLSMDEMLNQDQTFNKRKLEMYNQPFYTAILKEYLKFFQEKNII